MSRPTSVIDGRDPLVLQTMLDFYAPEGGVAVDVTANRRRMWAGVNWPGTVTYMDADPDMCPDVVADFRAIPLADASVNVLIFDPPHLPAAAGSPASDTQMCEDYGLRMAVRGDNVSAYFAPFLAEAARVLKPGGLVFAKLKDYVHNHRYQWMLVDWVCAVRATPGMTPCDLIIKRDPCGGNLKSGRWQKVHHVRNAHCWWAVVRKGRCEPNPMRDMAPHAR